MDRSFTTRFPQLHPVLIFLRALSNIARLEVSLSFEIIFERRERKTFDESEYSIRDICQSFSLSRYMNIKKRNSATKRVFLNIALQVDVTFTFQDQFYEYEY